MKLADYLQQERISLQMKAKSKEEAIKELCELVKGIPEISDVEKFLQDVFEREKVQTTGIGDGVALPHARSDAAKGIFIAFGRSDEGVEFDSMDGKPVHLLFLIGTSKNSVSVYLKVLARLSRFLREEWFRKKLMSAKDAQEVLEIFREAEKDEPPIA